MGAMVYAIMCNYYWPPLSQLAEVFLWKMSRPYLLLIMRQDSFQIIHLGTMLRYSLLNYVLHSLSMVAL